jgi:predicted MFS family arabinose efflux permease
LPGETLKGEVPATVSPLSRSDTGVSPLRRHLTLALIAVVCALSYIDRQVFSIFMERIKADLALNDAEMGLLAGMTFSVFYILAAFPLARLADRGDRRLIVAGCITVWSLATAACSLATSGIEMALARIGLAAGEGGAGPASQSLLLHLYSAKRRTLVLSVLLAANAVGLGLGGKIGGMLSQHYDWRQSMVIVGLPGLLIALLVLLVIPEPRRRGAATVIPPLQAPMREVLGLLTRTASLRWVALTIIAVSMTGFPFLIWSGSFYQQVHGLSVHEAGNALFWPITGGLVIGNLLAGYLADRFGKGNLRFNGWIAAFGLVVAFPFGLAMALVQDTATSLRCFFVFHIFLTLHLAPMQAIAFAQVPAAMRAMLGASVNMIITLCGIGIGTFLVGALSNYYARSHGTLSLRYAMVTVLFSLSVGVIASLRAAYTARPIEGQG